ncbi:MAG: universal stress protein [Yoonia sp.]|uniref:universal stress protein n=1 Tax=Yoonia sp. TaxID=2212373 RepID=UPI00273D9B58|nr:universal stress protein [Yoonia sp.]MDP5084391.1 universal stress protein [Yoonia sp.]
MQRFKNIVVVCDADSDHKPALARALRLAAANAAQITLVDVIDTAPGDLNRLFAALPGTRRAQIADDLRAHHSTRLDDLAGPFREAGIPTQTTLLEGTAFLEIIRLVVQNGHDLLIKGVRPEGVTGGLFSRGYDLHLLRKCPCPVWMIKDTDAGEAGNILVAVDPDPLDATRNGLNTMVMEMATSLSDIDQAQLHVVNVWTLQEEQALRNGRFPIDKTEIEIILAHEQQQSKARLDALMDRFPNDGGKRVCHHIKGLPGEVIPDYAAQHGIDTIVMGTVGRTGIAGLFIGNTAETILNSVNCSVIAVKPPGFSSPVASTT